VCPQHCHWASWRISSHLIVVHISNLLTWHVIQWWKRKSQCCHHDTAPAQLPSPVKWDEIRTQKLWSFLARSAAVLCDRATCLPRRTWTSSCEVARAALDGMGGGWRQAAWGWDAEREGAKAAEAGKKRAGEELATAVKRSAHGWRGQWGACRGRGRSPFAGGDVSGELTTKVLNSGLWQIAASFFLRLRSYRGGYSGLLQIAIYYQTMTNTSNRWKNTVISKYHMHKYVSRGVGTLLKLTVQQDSCNSNI
jgi:hypothetical protein